MEQKVIDELTKKNNLNSEFIQCFDHNFLLEASQLAITLAKLGIKFDANNAFDQNVSPDVLEQLQNSFCLMGDKSQQQKYSELIKDRKEIDEVIKFLENSRLKKEGLELNDQQLKSKREQIEELNQKMKNLDHNSPNKSNDSSVDENGLEKILYVNERSKNKQLKSELKTLSAELNVLADLNLTSEKDLDELISKLEMKCQNFYPHDENSC